MSGRGSFGKIVDALPASALFYRFCKRYVDHYRGDNNPDMARNGELHWLRQVLPQCEIVFDVGANVGDWIGLALDINPNIQAHCFEPSAQTFERLKGQPFGAKTICNNVGLGSAPGEMTLWVFAEHSGISSLYQRKGLEDGWGLNEKQQPEIVRLDTLDAYCARTGIEKIDLMKVDVEGHELEVFKGAAGMLAQGKIQRIQFEYGGCNIDSRVFLKDLFDVLEPHGFSFYKIYPEELRPVPRYDQQLENFQYQNWVATITSSR